MVVDVAALGWDLAHRFADLDSGFAFSKVETVFPAVTCPVQASFRTASLPRKHGVVSNGLFQSGLRRVSFWEQAAHLVEGPRIWKAYREKGASVGMMFWQQSLGEALDLVVSPKPVHKHHGGMIQDCYSQPHDFYRQLCDVCGKSFNLMHYWGPMASHRSSDWIVKALQTTLAMRTGAPDVLFGYLPHMDYVLQREGPDGKHVEQDLARVFTYLQALKETCEAHGYEYLFFGDYAIEAVPHGAVYPNRLLREAGMLKTRMVKGKAYLDLFSSMAFAMVDHQAAHVYVMEPNAGLDVKRVLKDLPGVDVIMDHNEQKQMGIDHYESGPLVLMAKPGYWFAYPWWTHPHEAPDYAAHVDIHNKPGYDPCELFWGFPPMHVSANTRRVKGSHGRLGPGAEVAWTSSITFSSTPFTVVGLAAALREWLDKET